jgi:hypothetical protein
VFNPPVIAPGEVYQFDCSYETVELGGVVQQVKVANPRLCHIRVSPDRSARYRRSRPG